MIYKYFPSTGRLKISSNLEPTWIVEERELPPPSSLRDTDKSGKNLLYL